MLLDGQPQHLWHGSNVHLNSVARVLERMEAISPEFHASSLDEYSLATGASTGAADECHKIREVTRAEYWSMESLMDLMDLENLLLSSGASEDVTRSAFQRTTHNHNKTVRKALSECFNNCWPPLEYQWG